MARQVRADGVCSAMSVAPTACRSRLRSTLRPDRLNLQMEADARDLDVEDSGSGDLSRHLEAQTAVRDVDDRGGAPFDRHAEPADDPLARPAALPAHLREASFTRCWNSTGRIGLRTSSAL